MFVVIRHEEAMNVVVFDIETDGFLEELTKLSVAWTYDELLDDWMEWTESEVDELVRYLNMFDVAVAHNGICFDAPALEKLSAVPLTVPVFDTLVASRTRNPDRKGGHSLKSWGVRLKLLKGELEEEADGEEGTVYGVYSKELSEYCKRDVEVTVALFDKVREDIDWDPILWENYRP
jgi:uncharacterized protein YprB with RNaseH-like and TPR domain